MFIIHVSGIKGNEENVLAALVKVKAVLHITEAQEVGPINGPYLFYPN
jgi:hypothetical protein